MAYQVTFSGPSPAANSISSVGNKGAYFGTSPDFTMVAAAKDTGTYKMSILNYGGISGWPTTFTMTKSDSAPTNVIGSYTEDGGGTGTAVVAP